MGHTVDERTRRTEPASAAKKKPAPKPERTVAPLAHVVLVDARSERLAVMRSLLDGSELVVVVGEADTLTGAIEEVARTGADLAIVEIQMPIDEGLATVAALRQHFPLLRIVVCSFHHTTATKEQATANGADAYLHKPVDVAAWGRLLRHYAETKRDSPSETAG